MIKYVSAFLLVSATFCFATNAIVQGQGSVTPKDQDKVENYGIDRQKLFKEIEERTKTNTYTYIINGKAIHVEQSGHEIIMSSKQNYLIVVDEGASLKKTKEYEKGIGEFDKSINVIVVKPSHWFAQKISDNKHNCYFITKDGVEKFKADNIEKIIDFLKKRKNQGLQGGVLKFLWVNLTTVVLLLQTVILLFLVFFVSRK